MLKSRFFSDAFAQTCLSVITEACRSGDGLTLDDLHERVADSITIDRGTGKVPDVLFKWTVKDCVDSMLSDTVTIRKGPNGGYCLIGVERAAVGATIGFSRTYSDEEVAAVRAAVLHGLTLKAGGVAPKPGKHAIPPAYVCGKIDNPDLGYVVGALAHLPEFEVVKNKGICLKKEVAPAT